MPLASCVLRRSPAIPHTIWPVQKWAGVLMVVLAAALAGAAVLPREADVWTALGVLAAVAVIVCAVAEPSFALAVALVAAPFQPLERVTLQLPIDSGQALLALALFSYLLRWLAERQLHEPIGLCCGAPFVAGAIFLGVGLVSFVSARDFSDWLFECVKLVQLLLIGLIVANERDVRRRALIVGALFASAFGQSLLGIFQHHVFGSGPKEFLLPGTDRYRAYGTFEQPNPFGGYLGLVWPVAAGMALHLLRMKRCVWSGAAAMVALVGVYGVYVSGSRGALIGVGLAVAAMAAALLPRPGRWLAAGVCGVLLAFAAGVLPIPASLDAQLAEYGDIDVRDAYLTPINFSTIERLAHWQAAIRMAEAHPWLGVGLGNYAAAYDDYRLIVWVNALGHAHNYYLNLLAETGVLGLLMYLAWWGTAAVMWWRARRNGPRVNFLVVGLLGALGHLLAHSVFDNLYVANSHLVLGVWLGLGTALTVDRVHARSAASGPQTTVERRRIVSGARALTIGAVVVVVFVFAILPRDAVRAQGPQPLQSPIATPVQPTVVAATAPMTHEVGRSAKGWPIVAYQFGDGPTAKLLVGGIHGGYEFNTVQLMSRTIEHFAANPQEVPMTVTLYIVPVLNPDGAAAGTDRIRGRMNGNTVDLNRNWDHEWQAKAWHGMNPVSGGAGPFSEPETRAMRDFIREKDVREAVFYHSQLGAVFYGAGVTETQTIDLATTISKATRYPVMHGFPGQITTGNAIDYLTKLAGVHAVEIELLTRYDIEWARNLAGMRAFLVWTAEDRRPPIVEGRRPIADR